MMAHVSSISDACHPKPPHSIHTDGFLASARGYRGDTDYEEAAVNPQAPVPPLIVPVEDPANESSRETVGADDAKADAARAGADVDLTDAHRDSDGVPVGEADAEADAERAQD
jgi:hypothetical protein